VRDFTYVDDVVAANIAAASADVPPGTVVNVAGGGSSTLSDVIRIVEGLTGRAIALDRRGAQAGDVERTGGAIDRARSALGWSPQVSVGDGLARQVDWHVRRRAAG
jgi:nucleoside-diphosphate-sugar epimerase